MEIERIEEQDRVVAFIDVLGFKDVMLSGDPARRQSAIQLLRRVAGYGAKHGIRTNNLGHGAQEVFIYPEITTFSDNIVLSAPMTSASFRSADIETPMFVTALITSIVSIVWQGLHTGLLFRGAISTGRLYHDSKVVAGEGLVKAVAMEKETIWPRIQVDRSLLMANDEHGTPILDDCTRNAVVTDSDGRLVLNTLAFHIGVWSDYKYFLTGNAGYTLADIRDGVRNIRSNIEANLSMLETAKAVTESPEQLSGIAKALEKWEWVKDSFELALTREDWMSVLNSAGSPPTNIGLTHERD
jgi:hypothetical protein